MNQRLFARIMNFCLTLRQVFQKGYQRARRRYQNKVYSNKTLRQRGVFKIGKKQIDRAKAEKGRYILRHMQTVSTAV